MNTDNNYDVTVIGAGLAGSEAAWQIASRGHSVRVYEMRPVRMTKAHKTSLFAELVCSNSFRGKYLTNAVGLLKEELRLLNSLIMEAAAAAEVPAGGALAVDRLVFSQFIDARLRNHPKITVIQQEVTTIPNCSPQKPVIIATGPLTSPNLAKQIETLVGFHNLAFFDAISPIILSESIDHSLVFRQSRYDKGDGADYLNIPLCKEEYEQFVGAVAEAEKFGGHDEVEADVVENLRPFEGCMPIDEMVLRGKDTLRFGPMKPIGLRDPRTGKRPYAVIQLRADDLAGQLWSMVGFQTRLKHGEQLRIFRSIPALRHAEFVRLGTVHRNTFIDSPKCLAPTLEFRSAPGLFFAGQITGVEGYVESTAGGLIAGLNAIRALTQLELLTLPDNTAIGALLAYISEPTRQDFQPMNISFGLIPDYGRRIEAAKAQCAKHLNKDTLRHAISREALMTVKAIADQLAYTMPSDPGYSGVNDHSKLAYPPKNQLS